MDTGVEEGGGESVGDDVVNYRFRNLKKVVCINNAIVEILSPSPALGYSFAFGLNKKQSDRFYGSDVMHYSKTRYLVSSSVEASANCRPPTT